MLLVTTSIFLLGSFVYFSSCQNISVFPENDQILPINDTRNVSFICNVTELVNFPSVVLIWEVQGIQIQLGMNPFQGAGVLIDQLEEGVTRLTITSDARQDGFDIMVRCITFVLGPPPVTQLGPTLFVRTYGQPLVPGNLRLLPSKPIMLAWTRPANIPQGVEVNYTITINSTSSSLGDVFSLINTSQISIQSLEEAVTESERCNAFQFYVIASVPDVPDSEPAVTMDTIPLSVNVSSIDSSLRVDYVDVNNGNSITAQLSFMAVESCSANFPIRNYTLSVDGRSGLVIPATPTMTQVRGNLSSLSSDQQFQVGVTACSDVACRNSITRQLNTTDVQYAQVTFFENSISLTCLFASRSPASGCAFTFQVNQNGTGTEEFIVLQSMQGRRCSASANQRNGYMAIYVQALESDGTTRGDVIIPVNPVVVETEESYNDKIGCAVVQDVVVDGRAVSIAVPIIVFLMLVAVITILAILYLVYHKLQKKKRAKFSQLDEADEADTIFVDITSNNKQLITNSPSSKRSLRSVSQSVPLSGLMSQLDIQTDHTPTSLSLTDRGPPPFKVILDENKISLKVNKTALRRVAVYHSLAMKRAQSEGSMAPDPIEEQSILAQVPPVIVMTDEFKSMCYNLPSVEEEEIDELKSWGIINFTAPPPLDKHEDSRL